MCKVKAKRKEEEEEAGEEEAEEEVEKEKSEVSAKNYCLHSCDGTWLDPKTNENGGAEEYFQWRIATAKESASVCLTVG